MAILLTTDDTRREVFLKAEQAKIHTGSILPELDNPASTGDVLKDKDYINGDGDKKSGTLIITDTVQDDGYFGNNGYGVSVNLVSVLDRSTKILMLPEPNLKSENIVSGVDIFGVPGTARKLRVETGAITPAEDVIDITIPAPFDGYCALLLSAADRTALEAKGGNSTYSVRVMKAMYDNIGAIGVVNRYNGSTYSVATTFPVEDENGNIQIINSSGRYFRAGITYNYYVYYWEDDA